MANPGMAYQGTLDLKNMVIRLRYKQLGGHVHCRLFTARAAGQTFAKCGDLVFDEREWPAVKIAFDQIAEVLEEEYVE